MSTSTGWIYNFIQNEIIPRSYTRRTRVRSRTSRGVREVVPRPTRGARRQREISRVRIKCRTLPASVAENAALRIGGILETELSQLKVEPRIRIEPRWIEQPLDHFNPRDNRLWLMRYFERIDLWKPNGPIYLFIGGEYEAAPKFLQGGIILHLARETNGAMFMAEHRFYGRSLPLETSNVQNLKYLNARQATADLAHLIKTLKRNPKYTNSKVVSIGGSYAGNLSAWLKSRYPNVVDAALSSSAPVMAKKNFYEYLEVVSTDYMKYGTLGCHEFIRKMFKSYDTLLKTPQGINQFKKDEDICITSDMARPENQHLFFYAQASHFMLTVQYGTVEQIRKHCAEIMQPANETTSLKNSEMSRWLYGLMAFDFWNKKEECFDVNFDYLIDEIKSGGTWLTSWAYQKCSEFSFAKSTTSDRQPFTKNIPIETFYKICIECFGPTHDERHIELAVNRTNAYFGGKRPRVKNVIFVNGELDPWHTLGVLEDLGPDVPAVFIPQASHCAEMKPDKPGDSKALITARKYVKNVIKRWIGFHDTAHIL
ncbi:Thymus-specific serine protease [Eumeta japonica]|uniref:Thymus-specific serine protease n=1 Tax=Eumeta variegata TaxID=151549 RepID=A0A4C1XVV0_EUMVA|nr:Thymus-specific serine protease [Eumeta japonica]